jgi:hypothetical protein
MKRYSNWWMQSKIPPIRTPKDTEQILSPRCAMEDSFCKLVLLELRGFQQGKYEEEEEGKGKDRGGDGFI